MSGAILPQRFSRRAFLGTVGAAAGAVGFMGARLGAAQTTEGQLLMQVDQLQAQKDLLLRGLQKVTFYGGGVNVRHLPDPTTGELTSPIQDIFGFSPEYMFFRSGPNSEPALLRTQSLGELRLEPNTFSISVVGSEIGAKEVVDTGDGGIRAVLTGSAGCSLGTAASKTLLGGKEVTENGQFEITATDFATPEREDTFSIKLSFDTGQSRTLYSVFGPQVTFTGGLVAGDVTIKELSRVQIYTKRLA